MGPANQRSMSMVNESIFHSDIGKPNGARRQQGLALRHGERRCVRGTYSDLQLVPQRSEKLRVDERLRQRKEWIEPVSLNQLALE